jgi:hypothetical protein
MKRSFKFLKEEDNKWYVVLPEWTGEKEELEMVCGADTMLDILSQGDFEVNLTLSDEKFNHNFTLEFLREESGGGWYELQHEHFNFEVWLCHVTKFVFGNLPKTIYCK